MKNFIINLVAKLGGVSKAWDFLDGKKAYGTGAIAILGSLIGLSAELAPILASHNTAALFAFVTHINSDPAYLALLGGFGVIAAAHKADKVIAATAPAVEAPANDPVEPAKA